MAEKNHNYLFYVILALLGVGLLYWTNYLTMQQAAGVAAAIVVLYIIFFYKILMPSQIVTYKPIDHEKEIPLFEDKLLRMGRRIKLADTAGEPKHGAKGAEPYLQYYKGWEFNLKTLRYDLPCIVKIAVLNRAIIDIEHDHIHFENAFSDWSGAPKGLGRSHPDTIYRPLPIQIKTESKPIKQIEEDLGESTQQVTIGEDDQ